jgi:hypothetical protein
MQRNGSARETGCSSGSSAGKGHMAVRYGLGWVQQQQSDAREALDMIFAATSAVRRGGGAVLVC